MSHATFFLSTGRCGTQWLWKNLEAVYSDLALVTHEPILRNYTPRFLLGLGDPAKAQFANVILDHAAAIDQGLQSKRYIECGWPSFAAIEWFAKRLAGRIRVVHLVRHPVPTAASMLTHSYYRSDLQFTVNSSALLQPSDAGVSFPEYRDRWSGMTRFEKCLYFWAEVNTLGLRLEGQLGVPFLRLKFEELFRADGLDRTLDFLELPRRDAIYEARTVDFDRWRHYTRQEIEPSLVARHPEIMAVATRLGYDALDVDVGQIKDRYATLPGRKTQIDKSTLRTQDPLGREVERQRALKGSDSS